MDFKHVMSEKTDEELQNIVTLLRNDYQPVAVAAAEEELTARGVVIPIVANESNAHQYSEYAAEYAYARMERFGEYFIDGIAISVMNATIAGIFYIYLSNYVLYCILILAIYGYYFLFENYGNGKTIGKEILHTRVVNLDGSKPTVKAIAIRTLCRFIPFEIFSFLWGGKWKENHNVSGNWHDAISRTYVVKEKLLDDFITKSRNDC